MISKKFLHDTFLVQLLYIADFYSIFYRLVFFFILFFIKDKPVETERKADDSSDDDGPTR